jgi:hypothetical protein
MEGREMHACDDDTLGVVADVVMCGVWRRTKATKASLDVDEKEPVRTFGVAVILVLV